MEFISCQSSSGFKSSKNRQTVRSVVTKRQHRLKREAEQRAAAENQEPRRENEHAEHQAPPDLEHRRPQPRKNGIARPARPPHDTRIGSSSLSSNTIGRSIPPISPPPRLPPQLPNQVMVPCETTFHALESFIHSTMIPAHVQALGLNPSEESPISSQWFSSSSMREPSLYTSALLTAAPNFKDRASSDLIFHLQSTTITSLLQALSDPVRRQDPALILAVECLSFYECLHGDKTLAQKVHRPAMRRLIQAQGGSRDALDIPLSWKKVSLMADILMEIQMGSEKEGGSSFLEDERHENGKILENDWTDALRIYLPDADEKDLKIKAQDALS
ncbi:hypothetical protein AC579_5627 [Pseudocercospora musae]|uniref:Uncharacterized protein n=1 Tax=Pseudocercospora musae TaxID=113226 RepID=A0A139IEF8_9PEZI|nr:hypothetical protein AC579_5627 [Pseudocercospora musae]